MSSAMPTVAVTASERSMSLAELCQRALRCGGHTSKPILGITDDSRRVKPGWLYVAIRGATVDGHDFVPAAIAAGAAAVVGERSTGAPRGVVELIVPDSRRALARLMASWTGLDRLIAERSLRVLGITGTNGKSTFTFMSRALLEAAGFKAALIGTVTYDLVGRSAPAPLTTPSAVQLSEMLVEAASHGARFATMEVSSISLDQRRADGVDFEVAVFSNLTGDHLDYHGDMPRYGAAKKRFFDALRPGATAVVNIDDAFGGSIVADCRARVVRYGFSPAADLRGEILESTATGTRFALHHRGGRTEIVSPLAGRHNVYNAMAAAGAVMALGIDIDTVRHGLSRLRRVPGRLERVEVAASDVHVFVDYAHTDDALDNVLRAARSFSTGALWCVFGCGGDRDRSKRPRMAAVAARLADQVVVTSDNPRTEEPGRIIAEILAGIPGDARRRTVAVADRAAAIAAAVGGAAAGDTVIIAGKGHEDYQIIGTEKIHFDDVEVAAAALRRRAGAGAG